MHGDFTTAMILRVGLCPGLTPEMLQHLKTSGIKTVEDLVSSDLEEIAQKCSLSYKALAAVRRILLAQFASFPVNGADLYEELKNTTAILSTGSKSLDKLLDSGLYTGEVTELVGAPGAGKTQAEALQRVQVIRVFNAYKMLDALQEFRSSAAHQVVSASGPVKVLVIDSISAVVYPLLGSRQPDGMALMMHLAWEVKTLARELGMAVVLTNHVTRDSGNGHLKPALGRSWSFVPSTRVLLEDSKESCGGTGTSRIASLTKCPRQPVGIRVDLDLGNWDLTEGAA
uniref:DNA repair protein RAD51 homolog 4 isoform X3 n=1 Tax=Podarcis muralis TaxID=64176 RepID=UPI00109FC098|nr:DNA repair protein RAD51 homolog 4 isoform X3 [Podarcis muralis]